MINRSCEDTISTNPFQKSFDLGRSSNVIHRVIINFTVFSILLSLFIYIDVFCEYNLVVSR